MHSIVGVSLSSCRVWLCFHCPALFSFVLFVSPTFCFPFQTFIRFVVFFPLHLTLSLYHEHVHWLLFALLFQHIAFSADEFPCSWWVWFCMPQSQKSYGIPQDLNQGHSVPKGTNNVRLFVHSVDYIH